MRSYDFPHGMAACLWIRLRLPVLARRSLYSVQADQIARPLSAKVPIRLILAGPMRDLSGFREIHPVSLLCSQIPADPLLARLNASGGAVPHTQHNEDVSNHMISRLNHTASIPTVYASRSLLPDPMQDSFPAGWLTFTGRESNPLDFNKRFQLCNILLFRTYPDASWAHARRYFVEAEGVIPKAARGPEQLATQFIAAIGELYAIEAKAKELSHDLRGQRRQEQSRPVLAKIEGLLLQHLHGVTPGSLLGKALHYLSSQWPKLTRFIENGAWPIDNNLCENAIRPFVVGRRNWLFCDTVAGARASANLYSLIETCKANGIEPYTYLVELFRQLPLAKTVEDFEALLPWRLANPTA
jgi:hypothetical protein